MMSSNSYNRGESLQLSLTNQPQSSSNALRAYQGEISSNQMRLESDSNELRQGEESESQSDHDDSFIPRLKTVQTFSSSSSPSTSNGSDNRKRKRRAYNHKRRPVGKKQKSNRHEH